jgi:hypothetical protein
MIPLGPGGALTNHLQQEDDIGVHRADRFAKAVQDNPPVPPGKTFVNIDGYQTQFLHADGILSDHSVLARPVILEHRSQPSSPSPRSRSRQGAATAWQARRILSDARALGLREEDSGFACDLLVVVVPPVDWTNPANALTRGSKEEANAGEAEPPSRFVKAWRVK